MEQKLKSILLEAEEEFAQTDSLDQLNEARVRFLGKKGQLTAVLRGMAQVEPQERPRVGQMANEVRQKIEQLLELRLTTIKEQVKKRKLAAEKIDVTLPGTAVAMGHKHPLSLIQEQIEDIFLGMGYSIEEGPEIELDYYNFEALNLPKDHPARDMQDSFFISPEVLLRTHTSPVQIRTMERDRPKLPVRIIAPGRVYRRDDDATHSPMFNQIEGLVLDKKVTFGDLKGTLQVFAEQMFGTDTKTRFRPSFFPFTEPSAEVDISCCMCQGSGCRVCSGTGWLEILGCGMVHPRVLTMSGYDPEQMSGFAFGMGIERIAMLKYEIDDLRLLFENDLRFLAQF